MKNANEFRIGLWTIIAVIVLLFGIKFLKGQIHTSSTYYLVSTNVDGLAESSHVKMNGFRIGLVRDMDYDYTRGNVIITLDIDPDLRLPQGTSASIEPDLLSSSNVIIKLGTGSDYLQPGDTLLGGSITPGLMEGAAGLLPSVTDLLPKVDSILTGLNTLVNDSRLHESMLEVNTLVSQLQTTISQLNSQLPVILSHADNAVANLDTLSGDMRQIDLKATLDEANHAIGKVNTLLETLNGTDGTAARLLNTNQLHDELQQTLHSVDSLVSDIKENPKRYINIKVFGK
ncbi:MAG: MCE family protein [Bacteroidales bacterium]|nr:MCE family protein [Candidatus Liminaster caballi]